MSTTQTEHVHDSPFHVILSEEYVQDSFHSYLKSSLTHAKVEGLLGTDILSSAEADLMITGPALCLYFAALRSTTEPPSVPLPKRSKSSSGAISLSHDNCPPTFRSFWMVWSHSVPEIQLLPPEYQHDLARIICGLSPVSSPPNPRLNGIAADLRAVAIEISMRRTFQDRYAGDLQAAIDAGTGGSATIKASFTPPPSYNTPPKEVPPKSKPARPSVSVSSAHRHSHSHSHSLSPIPPTPRAPSPSILTPDSPAIEFIRETLYAALADVLERTPALRRWLRKDPARGYFAAVAFAILDVASGSATHASAHPAGGGAHAEPAIRGVLGKTLALGQCPAELRPFMRELCAIGADAAAMDLEDSELSVAALQRGDALPAPRLERVRDILAGGVGHAFGDRRAGATADARRRTTSTENRAVAFANRINALALEMTRLHAFKERQEMVFQVLVGVGD